MSFWSDYWSQDSEPCRCASCMTPKEQAEARERDAVAYARKRAKKEPKRERKS